MKVRLFVLSRVLVSGEREALHELRRERRRLLRIDILPSRPAEARFEVAEHGAVMLVKGGEQLLVVAANGAVIAREVGGVVRGHVAQMPTLPPTV